MKRRMISLVMIAATGTLLVVITPRAPRADPSSYRQTITRSSLSDGLGQRPVPLLEVMPPVGGADGQFKMLVPALDVMSRSHSLLQLRNQGELSRSGRGLFLSARDRSWYLEVKGDGSSFRYRGDIDHLSREEAELGGPDTFERLGREFIVNELASLVPMDGTDSLTFLGMRALREGSATETEPFSSEVVARIAIFGREVLGTFVAGPGSKIAVWFSRGGQVAGFDVDWPRYRVTERMQGTLGPAAIGARFAEYSDSSMELIAANLQRFECGYVDLGVHKRGRALIQAGCFAHHDGEQPGGVRYASLDVVPIGMPVEVDPDWPVTPFVAEGRPYDLCEAVPAACVEPPPAGGVAVARAFYLHGDDVPLTADGFTMNDTPSSARAVQVNLVNAPRWYSDPPLAGTFVEGARFTLVKPCTLGLSLAPTYTLALTDAAGNEMTELGQATQPLGLCLGQEQISIPVQTPVDLVAQRLKLTISSVVGLDVNLSLGKGMYLQATNFVESTSAR